MPQLVPPNNFITTDSLNLDTIWIDVESIPAKTFNPPDTPDLVLFNVDSSIKYLVNTYQIDTAQTHKILLRDTNYVESFVSVPGGTNSSGTPIYVGNKAGQNVFSSIVLGLVLIILAFGAGRIRSRLVPYLLGIFDQRVFKDQIAESTTGFFPPNLILFILQTLIVGSVIGVWAFNNTDFGMNYPFYVVTLSSIAAIGVLPIVRNLLLRILGRIFMIDREAQKHVYISYLSHTLLMLLMVPIAIQFAIQYPGLERYYTTAIGGSLLIALIYQLFKLFQNTPLPNVGALFYIFLYFCTLELLPLFLFYKAVTIYS